MQDLEVERRSPPEEERDLEVVRQDVVEAALDGQFLHPFRWFLVQDLEVAKPDLEERSPDRSKAVGSREVGCPFLEVLAGKDWIARIHHRKEVMNITVTYIERSVVRP